MLQCLRNCLAKSRGKPKLDTLNVVVDYMIPLGRKVDGLNSTKLDNNVDLADVRRAANACLGAAIASASSNAATKEEDLLKLMPWCEASDSNPCKLLSECVISMIYYFKYIRLNIVTM